MRRFWVAICLAAVVSAGLAGCGYNFRGKTNNLPADVRTIAVPVFQNHTGEPRIESIFTDEVIFQFTRSQIVRVVDQTRADAVLRGVITRADVEDVALTAQETSQQRRIVITLKAWLTRTSDGQVLWRRHALKQQRTYQVAASPAATESNKIQAVDELAQSMAQTLHDSVFENF